MFSMDIQGSNTTTSSPNCIQSPGLYTKEWKSIWETIPGTTTWETSLYVRYQYESRSKVQTNWHRQRWQKRLITAHLSKGKSKQKWSLHAWGRLASRSIHTHCTCTLELTQDQATLLWWTDRKGKGDRNEVHALMITGSTRENTKGPPHQRSNWKGQITITLKRSPQKSRFVSSHKTVFYL